jgi:hypothetical protein
MTAAASKKETLAKIRRLDDEGALLDRDIFSILQQRSSDVRSELAMLCEGLSRCGVCVCVVLTVAVPHTRTHTQTNRRRSRGRLQNQQFIEKEKIVDRLKRIRANVKLFKDVLATQNVLQDHFVDRLRTHMETAETSIMHFKSKQKDAFEDLVQQEKLLTKELAAYKAKMDAWQSPAAAAAATPKAAKSQANSRPRSTAPSTTATVLAAVHSSSQESEDEAGHDDKAGADAAARRRTTSLAAAFAVAKPKEIEEYERFLAKHGSGGGWDRYEHGTFLRLCNKYGNGERLAEAVVEALPGRRHEEVEEHERWWALHEKMLAAKKEAIARWRAQRNEAAHAGRADSGDDGEREEGTDPAGVREHPNTAGDLEVMKARAEKIDAERTETKARVAAWRAQQAARAREEEENTRKQQLLQSRVVTADEATRRAKTKAQVAEYRTAKQQQQCEQARENGPSPSRVTATDLAARRAADAQWLKERKEAAAQIEKEDREREQRLAALRAMVRVGGCGWGVGWRVLESSGCGHERKLFSRRQEPIIFNL